MVPGSRDRVRRENFLMFLPANIYEYIYRVSITNWLICSKIL